MVYLESKLFCTKPQNIVDTEGNRIRDIRERRIAREMMSEQIKELISRENTCFYSSGVVERLRGVEAIL